MLPRLMAALTAGMLVCLGMASTVRAQQPIPPTHYSTDERGVDLTNGGYFPFVTEVVIGQPGAGGLAYGRSHIGTGWRDSLLGTVNTDGAPIATVTVSIGGYSDQFTDKGGGSYLPYNPASSAALSYASGVYTYTTSTGVVASFSTAWAGSTTPYTANQALVTSITSPDGEQLTYTYVTANMCANTGCTATTPYARLQSVTNNAGYQIKYQYVQDGTAFATRANWLRVQRVTGLNNGVDYCAPSANTCTYTADWPRVEYATVNSTTATATDEMSRVTTYRNNTAGRITGIRWPGSTADNVTVAYDTAGQVDSITSADGTWTYDFSGVGGTVLATVAGPDGQGFQATSENGMIQYYTDADGEETYILWNAPGQPLRIDYPTGNSTEIAYDARGNVTEVTQTAASGSGLADIVTSATYPTSCTASGITAVNCNLPLTTTDTRGNVTTYEWSSTHGGLLSVTQPEPTTGADQPQSRIAYSQAYAWYRNSGGSIVQAATPIWRPISMSACRSGEAPGCLGTANERVTEIAYGATGVMNNLLPTELTNRNGTSSITVTTTTSYTANGDPEYVDGPLSGTGDQTRFLYNANREVIGVIGPDPDGAGGLYHRAARITRNSLGLPTLTEQGRTNGYTDTDWAAFVSLQQAATAYDTFGRPLRQSLSDGTTTYSLAQVSYDTSGRPDCTVVRMNPATFASPPTSACTAATAGSYGPDRISRTTYDDFGRVASVVSGYGTAGAIT